MQNLIPPVSLILENGIGHVASEDVHRRFNQFGRLLIDEMQQENLIRKDSRVLDVGCGLGRLARVLTEFLSPGGAYYGIDANKSSVDWCRENYTAYPNFHFIHSDVFSTHYNPKSNVRAAAYRFPFDDGEFDCVFSTSLFTHLVAADAARYIEEIGRVLASGGKTWNTFLLLDEISEPLATTFVPGRANMHLPTSVAHGRVANPANPEALIALDLDFVKTEHERIGLRVLDVKYGPWCGRPENIRASYQDVVVAQKRVSGGTH